MGRANRVWSWAAIALVGVVPLAVDPSGFDRFHAAKWFLVCAIVSVGLVAASRAHRLRWPLARWWVLWLAAVLAATLTSVAPWVSLGGAPQRNVGLVLWVVAAGAFVLGASSGADPSTQRRVIRVAFVVGGVVGSLAAAERFGLDLFGFHDAGHVTRARSTWGSATFTAGYLVLIGPLAVAHLRAVDVRWRRAAWVATAGTAAGLIATGTRGAWLGAVAAAFVMAPSWRRTAATASNRPPLSTAARVGLGTAAIVAVVLMVPNVTRASGVGRIDQWRTAIPVIAEHPVLGSGPDTQRIVLPERIDDRFEQQHGSTELHDRAHDLVLDTWLTTGLVGVLCLGALLVAITRLVVRRLGDQQIARAICAGLVAYLVHLLFAFGEATLDPLAWMLAGFVVVGVALPATDGEVTEDGDVRDAPRRVPCAVIGAMVGLLGLAIAIWAGGEALAERRLAAAVDQRADGRPTDARDTLHDAVGLAPLRFDLRQARARAGEEVLAGGTDPIDAPDLNDPKVAATITEDALADVDVALRIAPGDPDVLLDRAEVLAAGHRYDEAARTFRQVLAGPYPSSSRAHLGLGTALIELGQRDAAADEWRRAAALAPHDARPWLNLGALHERLGRNERAIDDYRRALRADPGSLAAQQSLERLRR